MPTLRWEKSPVGQQGGPPQKNGRTSLGFTGVQISPYFHKSPRNSTISLGFCQTPCSPTNLPNSIRFSRCCSYTHSKAFVFWFLSKLDIHIIQARKWLNLKTDLLNIFLLKTFISLPAWGVKSEIHRGIDLVNDQCQALHSLGKKQMKHPILAKYERKTRFGGFFPQNKWAKRWCTIQFFWFLFSNCLW